MKNLLHGHYLGLMFPDELQQAAENDREAMRQAIAFGEMNGSM
jgi:hypothetical protein